MLISKDNKFSLHTRTIKNCVVNFTKFLDLPCILHFSHFPVPPISICSWKVIESENDQR